jgi:hypothetical protein
LIDETNRRSWVRSWAQIRSIRSWNLHFRAEFHESVRSVCNLSSIDWFNAILDSMSRIYDCRFDHGIEFQSIRSWNLHFSAEFHELIWSVSGNPIGQPSTTNQSISQSASYYIVVVI